MRHEEPGEHMKNSVNRLAAVGLALGAVFGMAGVFVSDPALRTIAWAIDALGIVMAATLLTLKFFRKGNDLVAAGFLIFGIGEAVILSGNAGSSFASIPSFAAGTALWALGLLLVSIPRGFPKGIRLVGMLTAFLFFVTAFSTFGGKALLPTSRPLPFFAYPFLVITFLGWILTLLRKEQAS